MRAVAAMARGSGGTVPSSILAEAAGELGIEGEAYEAVLSILSANDWIEGSNYHHGWITVMPAGLKAGEKV